MKSNIMNKALILISCLFATAVSAETPKDVEDLVGARASGGEHDLLNRGFVHIKSVKGGQGVWSNWWNGSRDECLEISTVSGHFEAIRSVPKVDCNQYSTANDDNDSAAGVAVAIGVAALIGAVAAKHSSHHHDDGEHHDDAYSEDEYERGFRDGLHSHHYDNYENTAAYTNGYDAGVEQREHDSSYRQHHGRDNRHGYTQMVDYEDLEGHRDSHTSSALRDRGFKNVDGFREGSSTYSIWYNRNSGQCLQMTVADGHVADLSDIGSHPDCR